MKAVIFDIDGTLTPHISWLFLTETLGIPPDKHIKIFEEFKSGSLTLREATDQLLKLWQSSGKATKDNFKEIFESIPLREEANEVVDYIKAKGYRICLITGSMDIFAEVVAQKLAIADYFSNTRLVWNEVGELIDFEYKTDRGELKLAQLKKFTERNDINVEDCVVIGDGDNDRVIFEATKRGILVEKDSDQKEFQKELMKVAWKKIKNLSEIKNII